MKVSAANCIEAIHAVHGMASDFTKLIEAWLPKGETPSLCDLMAMAALTGIISSKKSLTLNKPEYAHQAYSMADEMLKARVL